MARLVALGGGGPHLERLGNPETVKMLARIALHGAGRDPQLESETQKHMSTKFKLILGGILLLLGIIFAMQNSTVVEVRFLVWSIQMSQALVIFLTGAVGTVIGFLFGTAFKISRQS
ncbi:MAG TPA: LapA family protein [Terrimicrobiaceae bacterium]|nr:LapA family protein [Terrimicrobiaceae bacterium]